MTLERARRKYDSLCRMTIARGCQPAEAESARRLAAALAARWGFDDSHTRAQWRDDFDARFARAEARTAVRFAWEYRRCGKRNCHCATGHGQRHGPYRYGKKRQGRKVVSVYYGR